MKNLLMTSKIIVYAYFLLSSGALDVNIFKYFPLVTSFASSTPSWYPSSYNRLISATISVFGKLPSSANNSLYRIRIIESMKVKFNELTVNISNIILSQAIFVFFDMFAYAFCVIITSRNLFRPQLWWSTKIFGAQ